MENEINVENGISIFTAIFLHNDKSSYKIVMIVVIFITH